MAVVMVCCKMNYKGQTIPFSKESRRDQGCFRFSRAHKGINHLRSGSSDASKRGKLCIVFSEKQLRSLDSYLGKLKSDVSQPSSRYLKSSTELLNGRGQSREEKGRGSVNNSLFKSRDRRVKSEAEEELGSLDEYLAVINEDAKSKDYVSPASDDETTKAALNAIKGGFGSGVRKQGSYMESKSKDGQGSLKNLSDETSNSYLISMMASINIGVYLFEIASPVKNSDLELFSLPSLYGAKINHLILVGEWWRLVTPMFLVQD